jgi:hypothetical protein
VSVLVVQGGITLGAGVFEDVLTGEALAAMTSAGGILIIGIALKLLDIKDVKVGNYLPALVFARSSPRSSRRCRQGAWPLQIGGATRRKPGVRISCMGLWGGVRSMKKVTPSRSSMAVTAASWRRQYSAHMTAKPAPIAGTCGAATASAPLATSRKKSGHSRLSRTRPGLVLLGQRRARRGAREQAGDRRQRPRPRGPAGCR